MQFLRENMHFHLHHARHGHRIGLQRAKKCAPFIGAHRLALFRYMDSEIVLADERRYWPPVFVCSSTTSSSTYALCAAPYTSAVPGSPPALTISIMFARP